MGSVKDWRREERGKSETRVGEVTKARERIDLVHDCIMNMCECVLCIKQYNFYFILKYFKRHIINQLKNDVFIVKQYIT